MHSKNKSFRGSLEHLFADLAQEWHLKKNGVLRATDVVPGSNKKVWWQCSKDHSHFWQAAVAKRTIRGDGCPYCSGRRFSSANSLALIFPEIAAEWHPTKNGSLKPNQVSYGSGKTVWWLCSQDHSHQWKSTINNRTGVGKRGCPICAGKRVHKTNSLLTLYPSIAREWHPTRNGSITASKVTPGSGKRAWWRCKKDASHEWIASVCDRTGKDKTGCPICSNRQLHLSNSLAKIYPSIAAEWHPTRNDDLTPSDVVCGSNKKVWWQCSRNPTHEWTTSISSRVGRLKPGCPKCSSQTSRPEIRLLTEFRHLFPDITHRQRIGGIECDLIIPNHKVVLMVDGWYFHRRKLRKDRANTTHLESLGYSVIRIRGCQLKPVGVTIFYDEVDGLTLQVLKSVLDKIERLQPNCSSRKLKYYKIRKSFIADKDYNAEISMLPFPPKERTLAVFSPEVAKSWHPTKNGELLPSQVSAGSHQKAWWLCPKDKSHEWEARIGPRVGKAMVGCPYCAGQRVDAKRNLLALYPKVARDWHPNKNGDLKPTDIRPGSSKKIWWRCRRNTFHEWRTTVAHRTRSQTRCPFCSGHRVSEENNLAVRFPKIAAELHPTKNRNLKATNLAARTSRKVWWRCSKKRSHVWCAPVCNRTGIYKTGCPHCNRERRLRLRL